MAKKKKKPSRFEFIEETAAIAGISLPAENLREFEEMRDWNPSLYRQVNRLVWLRETGVAIKRVPMVDGTRVKTVDDEIATYGF